MATFSGVTRQHILQAIAECDTRGRDDFLGVYGFTANGDYTIVHNGTSYDLPAILGVAHRYATGRLAPAHEITASLNAATTLVSCWTLHGPRHDRPAREPAVRLP